MIRDVADSTEQNLEVKVYSKLVLKVLMPEQKKERVFMAEMFLNDCEADPTLLEWIITG